MEEKRTEAAIRAAVEAILFAAGGSVEAARLASALELDPGEMEEITLGRKELEQIKGKKELMMFTHRTRKMWKYMKMHLRCGDKFIKTWQIKHLI